MKTSGQIRAQLEEADRNVSGAVAQLLAGPADNPGFYQSLQTAAKLLSQLHTHFSGINIPCGAGPGPARDPRSRQIVENLQTNAARAQRLLASAAAFYGCAISTPSSDSAVYTADGLLHSQD